MTSQLFFKISNSNETIKNQIKDKINNSIEALSEYVWNAIDANAKEINIEVDFSGKTLRKIIIKDNGKGINYEEIQKSLFKFLSDSPKSKEHKDYLTLPHGKNGLGRFAFIKFAHQINWEIVYEKEDKNYFYEIEIDSNSLNDVQKIKDNTPTNNLTGTTVKITRIDIEQDLIKDEKNPLLFIKNHLIQEFYSVIQLHNIKIILNKELLDVRKLIKGKYNKKIKVDEQVFDVNIINWNQSFCKDFRYYLLNEKEKEVYNFKSPVLKYDDNFLHSVYIKGAFFDNFSPASQKERKDSKQQPIFDKEKFELYNKLIEKVTDFLNKTRTPFSEDLANKYVDNLDKKGYFDDIMKTKHDKDFKKPTVKEITVGIIKFAPKISERMNREQTLIFLNLINRLIDDDKYIILDILRILLSEENKDSLDDLKKVLDKYKISEVTSAIHEIDKRLQVILRLEKMHYEDKNADYQEKDLQDILNNNFWVFGDNYNSLICSEEDTFTKMRDLFVKEVLKQEDIPKDKVSRKQPDLFIHGFVEIDQLNKNLIVEIKKPSISLTKDIYHEQLIEYGEIIRKRPEFNDPKKNEWHLLLIGHDFADDFFETHYKKKSEYLMEELELFNMRFYVMKWSNIISDLKLKYKFLRDRLIIKKEKVQ